MDKIFESADRYLARSDWKDIALLKFCLFSMGLFAGSYAVKKEHKQAVRAAAAGVFAVTYVPLMYKYYLVVKEMIEEEQ
ncbi:MAG: hypothetical protein K6G61_04385 [Solobacterium sp.]|nr:hypothetical protein [Solobacterium sp.]